MRTRPTDLRLAVDNTARLEAKKDMNADEDDRFFPLTDEDLKDTWEPLDDLPWARWRRSY